MLLRKNKTKTKTVRSVAGGARLLCECTAEATEKSDNKSMDNSISNSKKNSDSKSRDDAPSWRQVLAEARGAPGGAPWPRLLDVLAAAGGAQYAMLVAQQRAGDEASADSAPLATVAVSASVRRQAAAAREFSSEHTLADAHSGAADSLFRAVLASGAPRALNDWSHSAAGKAKCPFFGDFATGRAMHNVLLLPLRLANGAQAMVVLGDRATSAGEATPFLPALVDELQALAHLCGMIDCALALSIEAKRAQGELVPVSVAQSGMTDAKFVAGLSHEIRTPMQGVVGMLTVLSKTKVRLNTLLLLLFVCLFVFCDMLGSIRFLLFLNCLFVFCDMLGSFRFLMFLNLLLTMFKNIIIRWMSDNVRAWRLVCALLRR